MYARDALSYVPSVYMSFLYACFGVYASPHLGSRQHFRITPSFLTTSGISDYVVKLALGRTGVQQMVADTSEDKDGVSANKMHSTAECGMQDHSHMRNATSASHIR